MAPELRGTAHLLLSGKVVDPCADMLTAFCNAIPVDPDELLDTAPPPLVAELQRIPDEVGGLPEQDRWLTVAALRAVTRCAEAGRTGDWR